MHYSIHFGGYPAQPQLHSNKVASSSLPQSKICSREMYLRLRRWDFRSQAHPGCCRTGPKQTSKCGEDYTFAGVEKFVERLHGYRPGGYHPIHLDGRLHDGRYRVIHKLGYGGYSTVWLCRDMSSDTPKYVAVKILVASESERECRELLVNRLKAEAIEKIPVESTYACPLINSTFTAPTAHISASSILS